MALSSRLRRHPPSMFDDETLMELPSDTRLTGLGLRHYADDEGRGSARPALIRSQLWPLHPEVTDEAIEAHLVRLEDAGFLRLYTAEERTYFVIEEWPPVDRGQPSRLPPPPPREALANPSRAAREGYAVVEREEEGRGGESERGAEEGERGGEEGQPPTPPPGTNEPSPFCSKHPNGTERPCGPCGTARKRHDRWLRDQLDAPSGTTDQCKEEPQ